VFLSVVLHRAKVDVFHQHATTTSDRMDLMDVITARRGIRIVSSKEHMLRENLGVPEDLRVVAMTTLGYLDEAPERTRRKNIEELIRYDSYQ
jgi:nitroreductase